VFVPSNHFHGDPPTPLRGWLGNGRVTEWNGYAFDSKHEATCAILLCRYVNSFYIAPGKTCQIDVGGAYVDFCVAGKFVEYHPVPLLVRKNSSQDYRGDFPTPLEYREFLESLQMLGANHVARKGYIREVQMELEQAYVKARMEKIHSAFPHQEVIFAHSVEEFYLKVIQPFGEDVPGLREFVGMFTSLINGFARRPNSYREGLRYRS